MTDGFQPAAAEQTDALERVYRAAAAHMNEQGIFQWRATFPTRDHIVRDIAAGNLFVLARGGELAGAVAVNRSLEVAGADDADAEWNGALPFAALHRFCVSPRLQGQGFGRELLRSAEALAFGRGCRSLRLMVLETNRFALGLYAKTGFAARGQFPFEDYGTFLFMEKDIPFGGSLYPASLQSKLGSKP
ncbi:GNAT family N-acetyltransferase [Treponema endosymbiont of Eucomonympha sp.]|uniref:GNAT family N-acetyltransferase n=1 Tax=Treponema endosymbiont of Eucomonympha sp. TaxID=1580831 RepID=UPI00075077F9|nr:GNAT family N-acetyltransferase [Treponema endosymbiont of Eucomonympha sp.]